MYFSSGFFASLVLHAAAALALFGGIFTEPVLLGGGGGGGGAPIFVAMISAAEGEAGAPRDDQPAALVAPEQPSKHEDRPEVTLRKPDSIKSPQKISPLRKVSVPAAKAQPSNSTTPDSERSGAAQAGSGTSLDATAAPGEGGGFGGGPFLGAGDGPRLVRSPKPEYPRAARRAQFEGRVVLEVLIDQAGDVARAAVVRTSGREDCDAAALETIIDSWRFTPAKINGIPVPWRERVAVSFELR